MDPTGFLCVLASLGVLALAVYGLFALVEHSTRGRRLEALEREVAGLRSQVTALQGQVGPRPAPATPRPAARETVEPPHAAPTAFILPGTPAAAEPPRAPTPPVEAAPATSPRPQPESAAAPRPGASLPDVSLEDRIGGAWLGWLGAITVTVTVALAIAWAYREGWITPLIILSAGWLLGGGLLAAGERFRTRLPLYGQGLSGAGLAALYVTTYAGHAAYGTLSAGAATLGLIAVGAIAIATAVRHNSVAIGWIGVVLAYASPVLLPSRGASPVPLFLYLTALNAVVLGISVSRRWVPFRAGAFAATALLYTSWHLNRYSPGLMAEALTFVGVNWAIFLAVVAAYPILRGEPTADSDLGIAALNPLAAGLAFYSVLHPQHHGPLAVAAGVAAAIYYAASRTLRARRGAEDYLEQLFFAAGLVLALLIVPLLFKARAMAAAWALVGAALTVVGVRSGSRRTRGWGAVALALSVGRLALRDAWLAPAAGAPAFFNERGFSFAVLILAFSAAAGAFARQWRRSKEQDAEAGIHLTVLSVVAAVLFDVWVLLDAPAAWAPPAWCAVSGLLLLFGWELRCRELRATGLLLAMPPILVAARAFSTGPQWLARADLLPGRLAALALAAGAAWAFECWRRSRIQERERQVAVPLAAAAAALVAAAWSAADLRPGWVPLVWLLVVSALLWSGVVRNRQSLRVLGLVLTVALTVQVLVREMSLPPGHLILLNSRAAAMLALTAAAAACAVVTFRWGVREERDAAPAFALLANVALLGWLSIEASNAAGRLTGAADAPGFALSAVWVLYAAAAILLGFRRDVQSARWGGMILLGVAVIKVYLVDTASLALGYRVLSFLVLALVLLGISFVYQRHHPGPRT